MDRAELTAICDEYEKEEASKHWSDQCHHYVLEQDGGIMRAYPAHQSERDPDGPPCPESRQTIEPGQYWFIAKFTGSEVQTPFRIMTKDEEKLLKKNWKNLKKEHEAFLKQEAEKARQQ